MALIAIFNKNTKITVSVRLMDVFWIRAAYQSFDIKRTQIFLYLPTLPNFMNKKSIAHRVGSPFLLAIQMYGEDPLFTLRHLTCLMLTIRVGT